MSPEPQPWWVTPGKQILFRTVHLLQTNWKLYRPIFFITLITDQNFFTLSTKQLFVSSKDKTCSHQSNRNLTHTGQGHHLLTFALLLTSLLPCTQSDVLCSWEGNHQFSKSIWIVHILTTNASSGTSTFSYTSGSWLLGLKLLSPFFSIFHYLATVFFSSIFHNRVFQISFLLILHRIPESNNLDIKGGSHYTLACEEKHFWKGMF